MDLALGYDNREGIVSAIGIFKFDPPQRDGLIEIGERADDGNILWEGLSLWGVNEGYSIVTIARLKVDFITVTIDDRKAPGLTKMRT